MNFIRKEHIGCFFDLDTTEAKVRNALLQTFGSFKFTVIPLFVSQLLRAGQGTTGDS
jgi:hypothetical protein